MCDGWTVQSSGWHGVCKIKPTLSMSLRLHWAGREDLLRDIELCWNCGCFVDEYRVVKPLVGMANPLQVMSETGIYAYSWQDGHRNHVLLVNKHTGHLNFFSNKNGTFTESGWHGSYAWSGTNDDATLSINLHWKGDELQLKQVELEWEGASGVYRDSRRIVKPLF